MSPECRTRRNRDKAPAPAGSAELLRVRCLHQNAAWCSCKKTSNTGRNPETAAARCLAPETISQDGGIVLRPAPLLKFPKPQPCAFPVPEAIQYCLKRNPGSIDGHSAIADADRLRRYPGKRVSACVASSYCAG